MLLKCKIESRFMLITLIRLNHYLPIIFIHQQVVDKLNKNIKCKTKEKMYNLTNRKDTSV